ncbi:MAG: YdeI/OmpD-associated family protein [Saprospiraceae bacterium]
MNEPLSFKTRIEEIYTDIFYTGIIVPQTIAEQLIEGKNRRVVCHLNHAIKFQGGLMPDGKGDYYLTVSKEKRKQLDVGIGEEVNVQLEKDKSKYGIPVPEEIEALLEMDDEGSKYFHALTLGKQRSLLYIVAKPKNTDTRLRKALVIVDYLKTTKGKLDFKELNQAFKDANKR